METTTLAAIPQYHTSINQNCMRVSNPWPPRLAFCARFGIAYPCNDRTRLFLAVPMPSQGKGSGLLGLRQQKKGSRCEHTQCDLLESLRMTRMLARSRKPCRTHDANKESRFLTTRSQKSRFTQKAGTEVCVIRDDHTSLWTRGEVNPSNCVSN